MTAWVVSQTSRFKAARMGAGLSDLQSMYGTTDIPGYIGTFFSGIPDAEDSRLSIAPVPPSPFVDQVTTPLLILHGGSDERVPIGQAMEYYRALQGSRQDRCSSCSIRARDTACQSTIISSTRCVASMSGSLGIRWVLAAKSNALVP